MRVLRKNPTEHEVIDGECCIVWKSAVKNGRIQIDTRGIPNLNGMKVTYCPFSGHKIEPIIFIR